MKRLLLRKSLLVGIPILFIVTSQVKLWAGSAIAREVSTPPYWCAELKLQSFVKASSLDAEPAGAELDRLNREHSPISAGTACVWDVQNSWASVIRDARPISKGTFLERVEIHGHKCDSLEKGMLLKGILSAHETELSAEADRGKPQNKVLFFRECPCPKGIGHSVPDECISSK